MSFNVVYAPKDKIKPSISDNTIPKESLILTNAENQAEAYYYDDQGKLKYITKKTSFKSLIEARTWINKYDYRGEVVSIFKDNQWTPFIVDSTQRLVPIQQGEDHYDIIDGGNA